MCKGQGRKPLLDARGLQALRRYCLTHRHDSVIDITKWTQEYFQKPLSVNTIHRAVCRCQLKLYNAKRKPYVKMVQKRRHVLLSQGSFQMDCFKVEKCSMVRRVQIWHSCWKSWTRVLWAKEKGDLPACHQRSVQKPASLMVWGCTSAYGMCSLHVLEATMNAERYIYICMF